MKLIENNPSIFMPLGMVVTFILLYFVLKNVKNQKVRTGILIILSLISAVLLVIRTIYRGIVFGKLVLISSLPFHMCNINCFILPIALITKNKTLLNFLYFIAIPTSLAGLLGLMGRKAGDSIFSMEYICFYLPHMLGVVLPALFIALKVFKPNVKYAFKVLLAFIIILCFIHVVNITVNAIAGKTLLNLVYTIFPGDLNMYTGIYETNPILGFMFNLLGGIPLLYLFGFAPVVLLLIFLLALPFIPKQTYKTFFVKFKKKTSV